MIPGTYLDFSTNYILQWLGGGTRQLTECSRLKSQASEANLNSCTTVLRGTIVHRTYGTHTKNYPVHIYLFLLTIFGLIYYGMAPCNSATVCYLFTFKRNLSLNQIRSALLEPQSRFGGQTTQN